MRLPVLAGSYDPRYLDLLRAIGADCEDRWRLDRAVVNVVIRRELAYTAPK